MSSEDDEDDEFENSDEEEDGDEDLEDAEDDAEEEEYGEAPAYTEPNDDLPSQLIRRRRGLKALLLTKYDSVRKTTELLGWSSEGEARYNICWTDKHISSLGLKRMKRMQKVNHFPGMLELVRKAGTARNLNKMLGAIGKEYKFYPQTFMLPADYPALKQEWGGKNHGNKTFILKPSKGCQGKGIRLTRSLDDISPDEPYIVQRYLHRPHLLNGYKYDLRLYVLLTSVQPLRIFLFREGLVRVCTQKYAPLEKNMGDVRMHLSNYSINKDSEAFVQPEDENDCSDAHKRTVSSLMDTLEGEGHDTEKLWQSIGELLGFDVMIDHKLRPSLLEINHTPSFRCDSPLDEAVKMAVLRGTMEMVSFSREEYKLLKRSVRISSSPGMRDQLVSLRGQYELHNADRLGFDTIYPPIGATCAGSNEAAEVLHASYRSYLEVATQLFTNM